MSFESAKPVRPEVLFPNIGASASGSRGARGSGDVVDDAAADGSDGGADAAHADPLEEHVLRGRLVVVLHGDTVVLTLNQITYA